MTSYNRLARQEIKATNAIDHLSPFYGGNLFNDIRTAYRVTGMFTLPDGLFLDIYRLQGPTVICDLV